MQLIPILMMTEIQKIANDIVNQCDLLAMHTDTEANTYVTNIETLVRKLRKEVTERSE
ncbi:hypothetical protein [Paludibacter sp. 221]|uniref:hypothetical protein n=1 Tax=Paludibacter sp. 221 TaxID=2302939 RepID=UPI0013D259B4|nr:hypothetical protein [Paludibacter sp. 221]